MKKGATIKYLSRDIFIWMIVKEPRNEVRRPINPCWVATLYRTSIKLANNIINQWKSYFSTKCFSRNRGRGNKCKYTYCTRKIHQYVNAFSVEILCWPENILISMFTKESYGGAAHGHDATFHSTVTASI